MNDRSDPQALYLQIADGTRSQDDPWAKRAAGEDRELHQHLAEVRPLELAR